MNVTMFPLFLSLLLFATYANAQHSDNTQENLILKNREFFLSHNILLGGYTYDNPDLNLALHSALVNRKKQRTNGIIGGYLLGAGTMMLLSGLLLKNSKRNPSFIGGTVEELFGNGFIVAGAVTAGCSIPFFVISGNRRRDMKHSLNLARELHKP